jgi:hypothetical protein
MAMAAGLGTADCAANDFGIKMMNSACAMTYYAENRMS